MSLTTNLVAALGYLAIMQSATGPAMARIHLRRWGAELIAMAERAEESGGTDD